MITAKDGAHCITRNSSFFKKIPNHQCKAYADDDLYDTPISQTPVPGNITNATPPGGLSPERIVFEPRRSKRARKQPAYLADYVV